MVHQTYLSGVELGKRNPSIVVLDRMAIALGLDLADLIAREAAAQAESIPEGATSAAPQLNEEAVQFTETIRATDFEARAPPSKVIETPPSRIALGEASAPTPPILFIASSALALLTN